MLLSFDGEVILCTNFPRLYLHNRTSYMVALDISGVSGSYEPSPKYNFRQLIRSDFQLQQLFDATIRKPAEGFRCAAEIE